VAIKVGSSHGPQHGSSVVAMPAVYPLTGLKMNPAGAQIQEIHMLQFLKCLFGFHGAIEIDYTIDGEEIKVCRDCLGEIGTP